MKLSLHLLLWLSSAVLLAVSIRWVVEASPRMRGKSPLQCHVCGLKEGLVALVAGRELVQPAVDWVYDPASEPWWQRFREVNVTGALPAWLEVDETTRQGNTWHIGRRHAKEIASELDTFLVRMLGFPRCGVTNVRGVLVRGNDEQLLEAFGIDAGDVLRSINGHVMVNSADVINLVSKQHRTGTRSFRTRWLLPGGWEVERNYLAPPGS